MVRAKPASWALGEVLTSAQANTIDSQLPSAIDGTGGGTYTPGFGIVIGGAGLISVGTYEIHLAAIGNTNSRFTAQVWWLQTSVADQGSLYLQIPRFAGLKLNEVHITLDGGNSDHAGLPQNMPTILVQRWQQGAGQADVNITNVGSEQTDTSGSVSAYENLHLISSQSLNHSYSADSTYVLRIKGESGTNSLANVVRVHRAWCVVTA